MQSAGFRVCFTYRCCAPSLSERCSSVGAFQLSLQRSENGYSVPGQPWPMPHRGSEHLMRIRQPLDRACFGCQIYSHLSLRTGTLPKNAAKRSEPHQYTLGASRTLAGPSKSPQWIQQRYQLRSTLSLHHQLSKTTASQSIY